MAIVAPPPPPPTFLARHLINIMHLCCFLESIVAHHAFSPVTPVVPLLLPPPGLRNPGAGLRER